MAAKRTSRIKKTLRRFTVLAAFLVLAFAVAPAKASAKTITGASKTGSMNGYTATATATLDYEKNSYVSFITRLNVNQLCAPGGVKCQSRIYGMHLVANTTYYTNAQTAKSFSASVSITGSTLTNPYYGGEFSGQGIWSLNIPGKMAIYTSKPTVQLGLNSLTHQRNNEIAPEGMESVIGLNGKEGFVFTADLDPAQNLTGQQYLDFFESQKSPRVINVYDKDGKTKVDTFEVYYRYLDAAD